MNENRISGGIAGGVVGGLVFGILMQWMGFMPTVAALVGSDSTAVGWVVHAVLSIAFGIIFAVLLGNLATTYGTGLMWGLLYGVAWWIVGALWLMPVILGLSPQFINAFDAMRLTSLFGHALFGLVLGTVYVWAVHEKINE